MALDIRPNRHIFPSLLKSCAFLKDFYLIQSLRACILHLGFNFDLYTANTLMNMYSKFHGLGGCAGKVLDGLFERSGEDTMQIFILRTNESRQMRHSESRQLCSVIPRGDGVGETSCNSMDDPIIVPACEREEKRDRGRVVPPPLFPLSPSLEVTVAVTGGSETGRRPCCQS
ncbi:hypothetical protein HN51_041293 [Arachis hypogaea]